MTETRTPHERFVVEVMDEINARDSRVIAGRREFMVYAAVLSQMPGLIPVPDDEAGLFRRAVSVVFRFSECDSEEALDALKKVALRTALLTCAVGDYLRNGGTEAVANLLLAAGWLSFWAVSSVGTKVPLVDAPGARARMMGAIERVAGPAGLDPGTLRVFLDAL